MNTLFIILGVQVVLGGIDNLWHHEITERLPSKRAARHELALHATREFLYAVIFIGFAWYEWRGVWAWVLGALLAIEIVVTITDFLVEDKTRKLPPLERFLHTVLAINFGIFIALLAPLVWQWSLLPSAMTHTVHGLWSWFLTVAGSGVFVWSVRNFLAAARFLHAPHWKRHPIKSTGKTGGKRILITGATGFIGSRLCHRLVARGDSVVVLTRDRARAEELFGPHVQIVETLDAIADNDRIDAIVNLAGAPIIGLPWTTRRRKILLGSRLRVTRSVIGLVARLQVKPAVLVNASAIGFYGTTGDEMLDERSPPQRLFQSRLCELWERMALRGEAYGMRVCRLRISLVLARDGGALPQLILGLRLGVGAIMGTGRQWMSWIHIDDLLRVIVTALDDRSVDGVINATAPEPVHHEHFMRAAAGVLGRRFMLPMPAWCLRTLLGEMAQLFVDGQRVAPQKLRALRFEFTHPNLHEALTDLLARDKSTTPACRLQLFYNGVCAGEMSHYDRVAGLQGYALALTDISREPNVLEPYGLKRTDLERRMYVRDEQGRLHAGVDAFVILWGALKPYRRLSRLLRVPGIYTLATVVYEGVLAPALVRYNLRRKTEGLL